MDELIEIIDTSLKSIYRTLEDAKDVAQYIDGSSYGYLVDMEELTDNIRAAWNEIKSKGLKS